jgi:hypothetical protein
MMVKSHENPNPLNVLEVLHFIKDASLPAHPRSPDIKQT